MEKKKTLKKHATRRLSERYGIVLHESELGALSNIIRKHHEPRYQHLAVFYDRQSLRVTRWFVWFKDVWLPVVYDKQRKTIVTVLPEGAFGTVPTNPPQ